VLKKLLLFFISVYLFASNSDSILKEINKTSPDYNFAVTLVKKTNTLKDKNITFDDKVSNQDEYVDKFLELVNLDILQNTLPKKIDSLNNKISILSKSDKPIDKLQTIYYQKLLEITQNKLNNIQNNFTSYEDKLFEKLKYIQFDKESANKNLNYWLNLLSQKQKELGKLNIDLQKWQLLGYQSNIDKTKNYIAINISKQKDIYKNIIKNYLVLFLDDLKNKDKKVFKDLNTILSYAKQIDKKFYEAVFDIGKFYEKKVFGATTLIYSAKDNINYFFDRFWSIVNYPLFKIDDRNITPVNFILFILVIILGFYIGKKYKSLIYRIRGQYDISYSTATLLANMGYYVIVVASFLIALKIVGLDLSSFAIIAGALSVGIGFGLQNIVSNFVSGIIMMFEKTIKVGDYIEIDSNTRGEIVDISMRSTVIRTNDNINLIIPNQSFVTNDVINWTLGDDEVRFRVPFGVAYGSKIDEVEKVILTALEKSNLPYLKKKDYEPLVVFEEMGDSSLNFELFVWVKGIYARRPRRTRNKFLRLIYKALNDANITIPFPQQDLYVKEFPELKIKKD
jgi:potassium efflux system protein